jgi:hypothetical protein
MKSTTWNQNYNNDVLTFVHLKITFIMHIVKIIAHQYNKGPLLVLQSLLLSYYNNTPHYKVHMHTHTHKITPYSNVATPYTHNRCAPYSKHALP